MGYKIYQVFQVFSEGEDKSIVVDNVESFDNAIKIYESKNGFLLLGIDAPTAFDVIYARPYGMSLIS